MVTQKRRDGTETTEHHGAERLEYLDGVRGIASIFIVLCHFACVFVPQLYYIDHANTVFSRIWLTTPLNVVTNGKFCVQWFFALSGFLLTRKVYTRRERALVSPLRTYGKLLEVVAPAVMFSASLMAWGGMHHLEMMEISPRLNFTANYNNFPVKAVDVLVNIFIKPFISGCDYVGPFWTIRYELLGSIMIVAFAWCAYGNLKYSKLIYLVMAVYLSSVFSMNLVSFMLGGLAYDCIYQLETDRTFFGKFINKCINSRLACVLVLMIGLYFATINLYATGIWSPLAKLGAGKEFVRMVGIAICLVCICRMEWLQKCLSIRPLRWLGSISAYTYAFHWPIILSVGCGVYVCLYEKVCYEVLLGLIIAMVLGATIVLAYAYMKAWLAVKRAWASGKYKKR